MWSAPYLAQAPQLTRGARLWNRGPRLCDHPTFLQRVHIVTSCDHAINGAIILRYELAWWHTSYMCTVSPYQSGRQIQMLCICTTNWWLQSKIFIFWSFHCRCVWYWQYSLWARWNVLWQGLHVCVRYVCGIWVCHYVCMQYMWYVC